MEYHASKYHPPREYPAMAVIRIQTAVESDDEFEDLLDAARWVLSHQGRWAIAQGHHPQGRPDGITQDEADVKLNWELYRLDRWRGKDHVMVAKETLFRVTWGWRQSKNFSTYSEMSQFIEDNEDELEGMFPILRYVKGADGNWHELA